MKKYIKYILLLAIIGAGAAFYMYNKPHKNIARAKADFKLESSALYAAFELDEADANIQYLDKVIEVSGTVREINKDENGNLSITLDSGSDMFGVICQLDELVPHDESAFRKGEKISLKGICTGMLMDVVLVRCVAAS